MAGQKSHSSRIEDSQIIRLSVEDQIRFAEMLANPPEPNAALARARKVHNRLITCSK